MRWSGCHVEVVGWRGRIGWWEDVGWDWGRWRNWFAVRKDRGWHWRDHEGVWRGSRGWCDGGVEDVGDDGGVIPEVFEDLGDRGMERGGEMAYHGRVSLSEPDAVM